MSGGNWSTLKRVDKEPWLDLARKEIYEGLEPWSPEKERAIPVWARELYYGFRKPKGALEARAVGSATEAKPLSDKANAFEVSDAAPKAAAPKAQERKP